MSPAEAALLMGGKELFKRAVTDVYTFLAKQTGRKLKQWNTNSKIETLYRRMSQVTKVKTIWQIDRTVDLSAFYCDSHVVTKGIRKKIHQLSDFDTDGNLVIQGIAGQGKSIFLRYLCSIELALGSYIPIFLELHRVSNGQTLRDRIYMAFKALGLDVDDELFAALSTSGKIVLLLDAFDEVPDALKTQVLTDIEDLASTYNDLRIIVTSRPNNNIQMSNRFSVVELDNLKGHEYAKVIHKLAAGEDWANALIKHIEDRAIHMKELLCTPLIVTLLVLSYKSYQKLPNKMADFYDSLFQTLLQRHDGTKPGFARKRACALDDGQYRQVFETLCILAKKTRQQSYSYSTIHDLTKNALAQCSLVTNSEHYVNDIVKITCLIIRDGQEHRFIHKTVQEYYTATFIAKKPEPWLRSFYQKILSQNAYREWHQELEFLSEIDAYRYKRYFHLPAILSFLDISKDDLDRADLRLAQAKLRSLLQHLHVAIHGEGEQGLQFGAFGESHFMAVPFYQMVINSLRKGGLMNALSRVPLLISAAKKAARKRPNRENLLAPDSFVALPRALDAAGLTRAITKRMEPEWARLFTEAQAIQRSLREAESPNLLDGLI